MAFDNAIDQAEGKCLLCRHEVVALTGGGDLFHTLAGVLGQNMIHPLLNGLESLHVNRHIGDLSLGTGGGLMDHDLRVGQSHTLTLSTCRQQESAHRRSHAHTNGGNITLDVLHGVVDSHTGSYGTAGAIDIKLNILGRILGFQIQKLGNHQRSSCVIDLLGQENDSIVQQTGKNIVAAFAAAGLLNAIGNETPGYLSFPRV